MPLPKTSAPTEIIFTFGSLVTDWEMYHKMAQSFQQAGFTTADCEFLTIDNSQGNQYDAYTGLNRLIRQAKGHYIILCHQDVLAIDPRPVLEARLKELTAQHPRWGVCGNAGGVALGILAMRISDPYGENTHCGQLPARVASLDENFLILRSELNLGLSGDLKGFHFYGTDICLQAENLGHEAYVIDFHLRHLGRGNIDDAFWEQKKALQEKYRRLLKSRVIQTTCTAIPLSTSSFYTWLNSKRWWRRIRRRILRRRHAVS